MEDDRVDNKKLLVARNNKEICKWIWYVLKNEEL